MGMTQTKQSSKKLVAALAALLIAAMLLVLTGCSSSSSDDKGASDEPKTLKAGSTTYFYAESLDPASDWDSWYLSYYGIVENLFKVGDNLSPEPWIAKSAEKVNDLTWKITLNDNVTFSNGKKVDAAAVKAAWERTYKENSRGTETLDYKSLSADGNVLTITTKKPVTSLENTLCDPLLCVYYVGKDANYKKGTAATGPYKASDFKAEDHITLVPNENYWNGTPKLDEVTLTSFADDDTLTMAMQNGEIDAVAMPSASALTTLSDTSKYTVSQTTTSRADFIRMNMDHSVIKNDAVRLAVAYCIDRDGYANTICKGSSAASWGVYSSTLPFGGTDGLNVIVSSCDVEAAKKALDDAKITDSDGDGVRELNGKPLELSLYTCTKYERFVQLADDLQSKLADAGIKLKIVPTDYFLEDAKTFAKDDPDMTLDSYAMAPTGNQAYFANIAFGSKSSNNFGKYSNKDVDALISKLDASFDTDERNDLARQIAQKVLDDNSYVFFANTQSTVISNNKVTGLDAAPSEYYFLTADTDVK